MGDILITTTSGHAEGLVNQHSCMADFKEICNTFTNSIISKRSKNISELQSDSMFHVTPSIGIANMRHH